MRVMSFSVACVFFFFKQKTAYEMRISDWSSDVCSSDLYVALFDAAKGAMDMQGWVTLTNTTGTTFADARTLLVAGDPNGGGGGFGRLNGAMDSAGTESGERERPGDYYPYPLPARTTTAKERKRGVKGKRVAGGLEGGGRRVI